MLNKLLKLTALNIVLFIGNMDIVHAQPIEVIADYPLISNLADNTENNTDVFLEGNPTPPTKHPIQLDSILVISKYQ